VAKPAEFYATNLITQPNVRIGRRETAGAHFKGDIEGIRLYEAPTLDINKIINAEWEIAKNYVLS
jgi:hypothetical protein